jgi:hypothetical protein
MLQSALAAVDSFLSPGKMESNRRAEILDRYGALLETNPFSVGRLRDLPFDRALIRRALLEELLNNDDSEFQSQLKIALMSLEAFVSDEDFEVVSRHEAGMKETSRKMQTQGPKAILSASETPSWEPYIQILGRVHAQQEEIMSCVRRLLASEDGVDLD